MSRAATICRSNFKVSCEAGRRLAGARRGLLLSRRVRAWHPRGPATRGHMWARSTQQLPRPRPPREPPSRHVITPARALSPDSVATR